MDRSHQKLKLLDLLLEDEGATAADPQAITRRANPAKFPLSSGQKRLWFMNQLEPGPHYNDHFNLRLQGRLDEAALEKSLTEIARRHEALRAVFETDSGHTTQRISEPGNIDLPCVDLRQTTQSERMEQVKALAVENARELFDLQAGPLLRARLVRLGDDDHVLFLTVHHIAIDGWSRGVLLRELGTLYPAFVRGEDSPLPALPIQYADFAAWQQQWMESESFAKQIEYWKKQLANAPALVEWPATFRRPETQSFRGAREPISIPKNLTEELKRLSQQEGCTLFMTLLAAFQALAARYTGQEDLVIGSPIANRNRTELEGLIGYFVNTLPLRADVSGDPTFRELVTRVRDTALAAYANQDLPFESLVEHLHPARTQNYHPIFQVVFILQNAPMPVGQAGDLSMAPLEIDNGTAKFDLTMNLAETADGLSGWIEFATDLFAPEAIRRLAGHYRTLLEGIVAEPTRHVSELPLVTVEERKLFLGEWKGASMDYPREQCIHEAFEEQASRNPEAIALVQGNSQMSYGELNRGANALAAELNEAGVRPGTLVALCADRSPEMIVALIAILKAGGAYVALDPSYPKERLQFMLEDSGAAVLLAHRHLAEELPKHQAKTIFLEAATFDLPSGDLKNPRSGVTAGSPANVIYTSGSTGKPKGTLLPHRGVLRLVSSTSMGNFSRYDAFLQYAPISFDASTWEIWVPLLIGAKLVIMEQGVKSLETLGKALRDHQVSVSFLTTGLFRMMVDERIDDLKALRHLWTGGDVMPVSHARKALQELPGCCVANLYGPTENSVLSTLHKVTKDDLKGNSVPIGVPLINDEIYILDAHRQTVPIGIAGELYLGGDGLAIEYLNRPELTAEKFVANPFSKKPGARLYRTGDLCRFLENGSIEFLGRLDQQVKIRGFRVELEEIETVMGEHPAVRQGVVVAREDAGAVKYLAAYYVPEQPEKCPPEELRAYLKARLPDYMMPSVCVMLETLPLSLNGKVDRKALPAPELCRAEVASSYAAPRTATEKMLADIWARTLRLERVGINDNFFDLGGHSLLLLQMHARLDESLRARLPIVKFFQYPTIGALAAHLETPTDETDDPLEQVRARGRRQKESVSRPRAVLQR